jgi:gamma-glutamyltranspeptidase/glutathione hydrolase
MLARHGFVADEAYVKACHDAVEVYRTYPQFAATCEYLWQSHLRQGRPPKVGEVVRAPALARLLECIAAEGRRGFYGGRVAAGIEAVMAENDGLITKDDLFRYEVKEREALRVDYRGYEIICMPLPSSGGICLAEILNILAEFDVGRIARRDPLDAWHLKAEAFKHAFADRANWLGDSDFVRVPTEWLTSKEYGGSLAARVSLNLTSEVHSYGLAPPPEDHGTSHFCIVDSHGNCVVSTETINTEFGSLAAVEDWGLILNNEMDDFAAEPGRPNAYGLIQSRRNAVEPGKRPLSSMAPTLVLKDRQPVLLVGASGGPRIITSVAAVLTNVLDHGMELGDAVAALRLHHQWLPDKVYFDQPPPNDLALDLARRGHDVSDTRKTAVVQAILIRDGKLIGASDPRNGGRPAGW